MVHQLVIISKVGRKGVVALPKAIRELTGIHERSLVIIEADEDKVVIRPLRVVRAKASKKARYELEKSLREDYILEEEKAEGLAKRG